MTQQVENVLFSIDLNLWFLLLPVSWPGASGLRGIFAAQLSSPGSDTEPLLLAYFDKEGPSKSGQIQGLPELFRVVTD